MVVHIQVDQENCVYNHIIKKIDTDVYSLHECMYLIHVCIWVHTYIVLNPILHLVYCIHNYTPIYHYYISLVYKHTYLIQIIILGVHYMQNLAVTTVG